MTKVSENELIDAVGDGLSLRAYEERLIRDIFAGRTAELGNAKVRSEVVRRLCMRADCVTGGQPGRICIEGGGLLDDLELTGLNLDFGLKFVDTDLQRLVLDDTRLLAIELLGGSSCEISADRVEIAHDVVTSHNFVCNGPLWLRSASIGGDLNCDGGRFLTDGDMAIMLDGARIGGRIFMRGDETFGFLAEGDVCGRNMRVAGGILCSGGRFERRLSLTRTQVLGDLRLNAADIGRRPGESGTPDAELLLGAMRITGQLSLDETNFHGPEIVLKHTRVEGRLRWKLRRTEPLAPGLSVDLMQTEVGYLHDDLDQWHEASSRLDGFSFDGVAVRGGGRKWTKKRKKWLIRQWEGKWSPYPYGQLRTALQSAGYEREARNIAIAREKARFKMGRLGPLSKFAQGLYWLLLGFGYKPLQFFLIAAAVVVGFSFVFHGVEHCGLRETAQQCGGFAFPAAHSPPFNSLLFSLDAFAPIDLGQTAAWRPNAAGYAYMVAVETSLGWLFAGLLVGAVTGILRRD